MKNRVMDIKTIRVTHNYSAIMNSSMVKKENRCSFTIPCIIEMYKFGKSLFELGEDINFMSLVLFRKLCLGDPKPTTMMLFMVDNSIKKSHGCVILCAYKG